MRDDMEISLLGASDDVAPSKKKGKKPKPYDGPPEDTDYQPFDWKKIVYSKKYIRM